MESLTSHDDSEVDDECLGRNLRRVVWVGQSRGDVEPEVGIVLHFLVTKFQDRSATCYTPMSQ